MGVAGASQICMYICLCVHGMQCEPTNFMNTASMEVVPQISRSRTNKISEQKQFDIGNEIGQPPCSLCTNKTFLESIDQPCYVCTSQTVLKAIMDNNLTQYYQGIV